MDSNNGTNNHAPMPVAFFGIAVGSLALAGAWRAAARECDTAQGQRALHRTPRRGRLTLSADAID
jgi:hypothetical protein